MKIHLGVNEVQYENGGIDTVAVAHILEDKYGVLGAFYDKHENDIAKSLEDSISDAMTAHMNNQPLVDPFDDANQEITVMMKSFLTTAEIESMGIGGVPTKAAIKGVNHRLKHPYVKANPRRNSFIDTDTYASNLKGWVEA